MKTSLSSLSSILEKLFKKDQSPFSEIYFLFQLSLNWKQLAGEEIAKSAKPIQFKNRELILALPDSTHLQEMHFAKEFLRKKINKRFPEKKIQKISLRVKKNLKTIKPEHKNYFFKS